MAKTTMSKSVIIKFQTLPYSSSDIFVSMTKEFDDSEENVKKVGSRLLEELTTEVLEIKAFMDNVDPKIYKKPACLE